MLDLPLAVEYSVTTADRLAAKSTRYKQSESDYDAEDELAYSPRREKLRHQIKPITQNSSNEIEVRASGVCETEGVWAIADISSGHKFGPFEGVLHETIGDKSCAWEIVDDTGRVKGWLDGSSATGSNAWMRHVANTPHSDVYNLMAVQVADSSVYYATTRDIASGEELLLHAGAGVYQERDLQCYKPGVTEQRSFPCGKCGELFKSKVALRRHETYVCNNENAIFSHRVKTEESTIKIEPSESDMPQLPFPLIAQHKSKASKVFYCENCPMIFYDVDTLSEHIRENHEGARSFPCNECGKTFATSSGLKQHQHIHSSVKPFQCEVCFKAYTQFSNLCRHKRMHAGCRQQISCPRCKQPFPTIHALNKHKPFCAKNISEEGAGTNRDHFVDKELSIDRNDVDNFLPKGMRNQPIIAPEFPSFYRNGSLPNLPSLPPLYVNTNPMMSSLMASHMHSMMLNRFHKRRSEEPLLKQLTGHVTQRRSSMSSEDNYDSPPGLTPIKRESEQNSVGESIETGSVSDAGSSKKAIADDDDSLKSDSPSFDMASYPIIRKEERTSPDNEYEAPLDLTCTEKEPKRVASKKTHIFDTQTPSPEAIRSHSPYEIRNRRKKDSSLPFDLSTQGKLSTGDNMNFGLEMNYMHHFMYAQAMQRMAMYMTTNSQMQSNNDFIRPLSTETSSPIQINHAASNKGSHTDKSSVIVPPGFLAANENIAICRYCAKAYPTSYNLAAHLVHHCGEQSFTHDERAYKVCTSLQSVSTNVVVLCGVCLATFYETDTLEAHLETHVNENCRTKTSSKSSHVSSIAQQEHSNCSSKDLPANANIYEAVSPPAKENDNKINTPSKPLTWSPDSYLLTRTDEQPIKFLEKITRDLKRKSPTSFPPSYSPLSLPKKRKLEEQLV